MTVKLNSLIVPDTVIKNMESKIRESQQKMTETGFSLCRGINKNIIKIGYECEGDECGIRRFPFCRESMDEYLGFYHTHPTRTTMPSFPDLIEMYQDGLGCIGSVKEDKIKCYVRKSPNIDNIILQKIKHTQISVEKFQFGMPDFENIRKNSIKNLTDEHFNMVHVK